MRLACTHSLLSCCIAAMLLGPSLAAFGAGPLPFDATDLADAGSFGSIASWLIDDDFTTETSDPFTIGAHGASWNHLTINNGYAFTAQGDMIVGPHGSTNNRLFVETGSTVLVQGDLFCGKSTSIAYSSSHQSISVVGDGARLEVANNLRIGSGSAWLVVNNTLHVSDGGVVMVNTNEDGGGDLWLANHWCYGNSWLELRDGLIAVWGDHEADFAYGSGMLSSVKVWVEEQNDFERLAYYDSTTWMPTAYVDLLSTNYIDDAAEAAELGLEDTYVGYTVLQDIPEPATAIILGVSGLTLLRRRHDR